MKSENKTLNEIMQKLRIEFLNYFRTHIYEIFIFAILLFLIYYVNCIFYFYYFYYAKMQKYAGHNISPFFEDFGPQSLKKILVCKNRYRYYIQCDGNQ